VDPGVGLNGYGKTRPARVRTSYGSSKGEYAIEVAAQLGVNSKFL
jgi:hypothetical protein